MTASGNRAARSFASQDIVDDLEVPVDPKNETYCKVEATFRHMIWLEERYVPALPSRWSGSSASRSFWPVVE